MPLGMFCYHHVPVWEVFWSYKVHNKICKDKFSISVRSKQINHTNLFWFDFLYGRCTWTPMRIGWESPASKTSQEQWGDHVSGLQHSTLAETSDPEAYHSLVPINTKPGSQSSTVLIVPQWKQGNWIVVFIDVTFSNVFVSLNNPSERQRCHWSFSLKKILYLQYCPVYLFSVSERLNVSSTIIKGIEG